MGIIALSALWPHLLEVALVVGAATIAVSYARGVWTPRTKRGFTA